MVTLDELLECDRRCRFPLDEQHWCGAETIGRGSWCAEHRRRVFLPPGRIPRHLKLDEELPMTAADEVRATWLRMDGNRMEGAAR
jgi:hypothetical protein